MPVVLRLGLELLILRTGVLSPGLVVLVLESEVTKPVLEVPRVELRELVPRFVEIKIGAALWDNVVDVAPELILKLNGVRPMLLQVVGGIVTADVHDPL